ncbi:MAG: PqqD family protein [Gaiellaceae bacterium]
MRFKVNMPPVIHQNLDGEVIVVNLDTGVYYSLTGVAADIWDVVEGGASTAQAVEEIAARYDGAPELVEPAVTRFVDELAAEELIVPAGAAEPRQAAPSPNGAPRPPFVEPLLHKYTDMQELLLLDPIHEVDEAGWPHPLADGSQTG